MAKGSNRKNENGLNDKQQKFADRYLLNGNNAAEAYRFAYNPGENDDKKASSKATHLMQRNVSISQYIDSKSKELAAKQAVTTENIYEKIVETCMDVLNGKQVVNFTESGNIGGKNFKKGRSLSKEYAIQMLVKLQGLDRQKVEVSGNLDGTIVIKFDSVDEFLINKNKG